MNKRNLLQERGILYVVVAGLFFGSGGTLQAFAPASALPATIGAGRVLVSAIVLFGLALAVRGRHFLRGPWRMKALFLAGASLVIYQMFFFEAIRATGVGIATIISIGSSPALGGLMGRVVFKERLSARWYLATLIAVCGMVLLVSGGNPISGATSLRGILFSVAAGFFFALEGVGLTFVGRDRTSFETVSAVFAVGALLALPILIRGDAVWIFSPRGALVIALLSLLSTVLSYFLFSKGLMIVGMAKAYTLSLSEPISAWLLSSLVLGERLSWTRLLGGALVCVSVIILASKPEKGH